MSTRALARVAATNILRNHFDTEASDAGLRSLDLESTGTHGARSYDASAVARADRAKGRAKFAKMFFGHDEDPNTHRRVRETLKRLHPKHVELLSLAYATRLRTRDTEDSKKRRAVRQNERNWRVRLAELYGQEGAIVLASPLARRLYERHVNALSLDATDALPDIEERVAAAQHPDGPHMPYEDTKEDRARLRVAIPQEARRACEERIEAMSGGLIAWLLDADRDDVERIGADARAHLNEALDAFADAHGITSQPAEPRHRSSERTRTRILASHAEHGQEIGG